ncbi:hypothetical protein RHMOL_Rhmol02G0005400 [Rhododendron molle]|uniref:Uncharacterized protein n=1 Tax=Rhododendron molle TaxID=49168 RepID=A0ACC0PK21_RHOML|nr:hypothetical protein RHMOL_Rhmol02G0005400 [Rhododendron molle]
MTWKDKSHKFIQHFTTSANIELKLHRYGNQVAADELNSLYDHSRAKGFGSEDTLDENNILISPAAPSATYKIGEKKNDPLVMYARNIMTVPSPSSINSSVCSPKDKLKKALKSNLTLFYEQHRS